MKLAELFPPNLIDPDLKGESFEECVKALVKRIGGVYTNLSSWELDNIFEKIMERERLAATCICNGIAVPHTSISRFADVVGCLGRCKKPVLHPASGEQIRLIFLLLVPAGEAESQIVCTSRVCHLIEQPTFLNELLEAKNAEEMHKVLEKFDLHISNGNGAQ